MRYILLIRHGEALSESVDPSRPLSERGLKETEKVAKALKNLNVNFSAIYHSSKLRAKQTAQIVGKYLGVEKLIEDDSLLPNAEPELAVNLIEKSEGNIILCGHLPNLARVFSLLYLGRDDEKAIDIKTSGAVGLIKKESWVLDLVFYPSLL